MLLLLNKVTIQAYDNSLVAFLKKENILLYEHFEFLTCERRLFRTLVRLSESTGYIFIKSNQGGNQFFYLRCDWQEAFCTSVKDSLSVFLLSLILKVGYFKWAPNGEKTSSNGK